MKYLVLAVGAVIAAVIATFVRYQSLYPCDWLKHDTAARLGVPPLVAEAKVRADFLVKGVTDPTAGQCLTAWWDFKANEKKAD